VTGTPPGGDGGAPAPATDGATNGRAVDAVGGRDGFERAGPDGGTALDPGAVGRPLDGPAFPETPAGEFGVRARRLAARAREERAAFVEPADPPDPERATVYVREGVGPTVAVYVEARTRDEWVDFSREEFRLLDRALADWLRLYAACYGVEVDPDATIRGAAELLLDTHSARDVAQLLTGVPER
jgi:hypothetical protein